MSEEGGYGSGQRQGNSDFGADFISFGSDDRQGRGFNHWRPARSRAPQLQRISGTQRSHKSYLEDHSPFRGDSNRRGYDAPFRRGGRWRGNRNQAWQRPQGSRFPTSTQDISSYYHPSMIEDPWKDLEKLLQVPDKDTLNIPHELASDSKVDELRNSDDSNQSLQSEGSE